MGASWGKEEAAVEYRQGLSDEWRSSAVLLLHL